uniref:Uncharacterized protein n=1 Tax=Heterorhabditis bacteriophora TaxID=37862 RepID=A0A1I7W7V6_HETBA
MTRLERNGNVPNLKMDLESASSFAFYGYCLDRL